MTILSSGNRLLEHLKSMHPKKRFPCPFADCGCKSTFLNESSIRRHIQIRHLHRKYPCSWPNCALTYAEPSGYLRHINRVHKQIRYPCPFADTVNCKQTFADTSSISDHLTSAHPNLRHFCPLAQEFNCTRFFSKANDAEEHAQGVHQGARIPCPFAVETKCTRTFESSSAAGKHGESIHCKSSYPGPFSDKYKCSKLFEKKKNANRHGKRHTHSILCPSRGCNQRFMTAKDALQHAEDPNHLYRPLFLCPLPICQSAVAGRRFPKAEMDRHRAMHVRLGHIGFNGEYVPKEAKPLPFSSRLSLFSLIVESNSLDSLNKRSLAARPENNGDSGFEDADLDETGSEEDNFEQRSNADKWDDEEQDEWTLEFQLELECGVAVTEAFSSEHRLQILERNTDKWGISHPMLFFSYPKANN
jgi:hypothetical protein